MSALDLRSHFAKQVGRFGFDHGRQLDRALLCRAEPKRQQVTRVLDLVQRTERFLHGFFVCFILKHGAGELHAPLRHRGEVAAQSGINEFVGGESLEIFHFRRNLRLQENVGRRPSRQMNVLLDIHPADACLDSERIPFGIADGLHDGVRHLAVHSENRFEIQLFVRGNQRLPIFDRLVDLLGSNVEQRFVLLVHLLHIDVHREIAAIHQRLRSAFDLRENRFALILHAALNFLSCSAVLAVEQILFVFDEREAAPGGRRLQLLLVAKRDTEGDCGGAPPSDGKITIHQSPFGSIPSSLGFEMRTPICVVIRLSVVS